VLLDVLKDSLTTTHLYWREDRQLTAQRSTLSLLAAGLTAAGGDCGPAVVGTLFRLDGLCWLTPTVSES